jgi:ADP-ribose pyrophosphatase YjhB (NUDIX family)
MYALPGGERGRGEAEDDAVRRHLAAIGIRPASIERLASVRHSFSHRTWRGTAFTCGVRGEPVGAEWLPFDRLARLPLVPLHRQLIEQARQPPKP